jgi:hypothetical protein
MLQEGLAMKALFLLVPCIGICSCASNRLEARTGSAARYLPQPEQLEAPAVVRQEAEAEADEDATGFDPQSITVQEKETTMGEMRQIVIKINQVIRAKDYEGWVSYLADDFIAAINSPDYLARVSESSLQLKGQNIVLRTPQDYFTYVVVASRENIRVDASLDDIEFLNHNRVKAFTINARKQRLRLFEFVKAGDTWKIAFSS